MKIFVLMWLFILGLHAEEFRGTFITEPIFNASVYMQTVGNPENPAVVLVHGLGDEASTIWESTIELLKNDYYVITFDLPGFGQSSKANELYSPLNYAKFIHYVTQTYVKKPFHLVGHSMGGAIALKYTSMYPSDVASLVLVDAAGILHKFAYSKFLTHSGINRFFDEQNGLIQGLQTQKLNNFIDKMTDKFDDKMRLDMDVVLASEELRSTILGGSPSSIAAIALVQENFNTIPPTINARTTIIWGEEDGIAPLETGYVLKKLMPDATLRIIPEAAHVPMLSHEKAFLSLLLSHLQNRILAPFDVRKAPIEAATLKIKNVKEKTYTGVIKNLSISDSQKIVIKDALIEELSVMNSEVEIINSTIKGQKEVIVTAQNASLAIIASDLSGAIKVSNSRLNLAGVVMSSPHKPIEVAKRSVAIFSLCEINGKQIHGKEIFESRGF